MSATGEPRKSPIGQHEVRMSTADGIADRIAELEAQADYLDGIDADEAQRLRDEARRYRS
jgi:hypothetical protein